MSPGPAPGARPRRARLAALAEWSRYTELDRRVWILAGVRAINTMGLALAMAFMAIYLVTERGTSAALYGFIYLIANLCQAAAQAYAGELSDRIGRRPVMIAALVIRTAVLIALGVQILMTAPIVWIALTLVVSASLRGFFEPVGDAVVADVAPPDQRVAAFGLQKMGVNLGWALGPAIGGLLAQVISYGGVFLCAAPLLLVAAFAVSTIEEPAPNVASTPVSALPPLAPPPARGVILVILAGGFLAAVMHAQMFSTLSLYAAEPAGFDNDAIGLIYTVNGIGVIALQLPAVTLIGVIGAARAQIVAPLIYAVAFVLFGAASGFVPFAGVMLLMTTGEVILAPAQHTVVANLGDPARMGRTFGRFGGARMLGFAVAPLAGGLVYDWLRESPQSMWLVIGALAVAVAGVYAWYAAIAPRPPR